MGASRGRTEYCAGFVGEIGVWERGEAKFGDGSVGNYFPFKTLKTRPWSHFCPGTLPANQAARNINMLFPNKITIPQFQHALGEARDKFPGRRIAVLYDTELPLEGLPAFDCRTTNVAEFSAQDFKNTVYIYACDSDEVGAPFVETVIAQGGAFVPVFEAVPSLYVHTNKLAHVVLELEYELQKREGFAKWDFGPHDFINLIQAVEVTRHLAGAFMEVGCYRGSSGCALLRYMREAGLRRDCYFLDVFEGFVYDDAITSADAHWKGSHKTEGLEVVEQRLRRHENPAQGLNVFVHKNNIIADPLPAGATQLCVANLDVDMYEAVYAGLVKLAPLMVKGGILIVEDPGHTPLLIGARVALNQFLRTPIAREFTPIYMQSGQTFLIRQ